MAINYPNSLDNFTNPTSSSPINSPSHADQHSNANDAIEALEAKVGVTGSAVSTSHDYKITQLESLVTSAVAGAKSIYQDVRNQSGSSLSKATPVYASGSEGASGKILVSPASNSAESSSSKTIGLTSSAISNNSNGQIISEGILEGVDTTGAVDGDPVWLGPNGTKIFGLVNKPSAPSHLVFLGIVVRGGQANTGSIYVKIQNGFELQELHNVQISSLLNGNIIAYDSTSETWKNTNTLQSTASTVPLVIKGSTSQSSNLQEWQNSAGTVLAKVDTNGSITAGTNLIVGNATMLYTGGNYYNSTLSILTQGAGYSGIVVRGQASQTANLQEWQDSAGNVLASISPSLSSVVTLKFTEAHSFKINWGSRDIFSTASGHLTVTPYDDSRKVLVVKGYSAQTANLQEWQNSAGTVLALITPLGGITVSSNIMQYGSGRTFIGGTNDYSAFLNVSIPTATRQGVVIRANASQSANLQEWQNSSGTVLAKVTSDGSINTSGASGIYSTYGFSSAGGLSIGNGVSAIYVHSTYGMGITSASGNVTDPTLVVKLGSINQTASLQEWHNSTGTVLANVSSAGRINSPQFGSTQSGKTYVNTGTSADNNSWTFVTNSASNKGIVIVGASSQTANLQEWQNNSGQVRAKIDSYGGFSSFATTQIGNDLNGSGTSLIVYTKDAAGIPIVVKGFTSQSANLQEWQDISGTVLASISSSGGFTIPSLTVSGNFTVNGTTTNINTTNLIVEDKNITIADVATPTDTTADGAGITIKGATDKTFNWVQSTGSFTSSEPLIISSNTANNITLLTAKDTNNNKITVNSDASNRTFITAQSNISATSLAGTYFTADGFEESWFNLNTRSNTAGQKYMRFGNLGNKFLVQRLNDAANAIISTPFTIENTSATNSIYVNSTGTIINGSTALGQLTLYPASASTIGMVIRGVASQTANLTEWQDSTGYLISRVDSGGSHWINAGPATSGTVETSSAYLYLTSNRWTGSASSAEVFGLNNFRFGGAGAAGAFALHLKPASSANAYLSIAGDSSRSVGVNVQYPSATSGFGQFGVQIQDSSYKGIVVRSAASQSANIQEWQNSSGTVLSAIDASGSFTSVSQPIQVAGSTYGFSQTVATQYGATAYWKIATLPPTTLSTCDQINIDAMLGGWGSDAKTRYEIMLGNRDTLSYKYTRFGNGLTQARIQSYTETDGSVSVYLYAENTFVTLAYNITLAAVTGGSGVGATIYKNPTASTTAPTGTKSFDTGEPVTYIPLIGMNNAGLLSTKSAIFNPTSASAVPLIAQGATSQTADLQQWKNSTGTTYLNVTNAGTMISNGGVTIASNPTINAYGAAMKIASGVNTYPMLIVQAAASQSANIQEWQTSSGTTNTYIGSDGRLVSSLPIRTSSVVGVGTLSTTIGQLTVVPDAANRVVVGIQGTTSQTADLTQWQNISGTTLAKIDASGNFSAISKSFDIPHPTKENMRLRYASLEGNEHGVYVRGTTKDKVIELPEYWINLVEESTITVSLTSVGKFQKVYVEKIEGNKIYIGGRVKEISYAVFGERKDIDKLIVEY